MSHLRLIAFASCLALAIGAGIGNALAADEDECRKGSAFADPDQQLAACDAAMEAASDSKQKAFFQFKRGEAFYWADQFGQALTDVDAALQADPELVPAYIRRAWTYIMLQQWQDASRNVEEVLVRQPRNAEALFALSFIYASTENDSARAYEALRQALEIDPNFHLARLHLAYKEYYYRGDLNAMLKEFETLLNKGEAELDKVSFRTIQGTRGTYPFSAEVRYERAKQLMGAKRNDQALSDVDLLIARYPSMAPAFALRGQILQTRRDEIGAIQDYDRAIELDPSNIDARHGRAWAYFYLQRFDEAAGEANWLVEAGPLTAGDGFYLRAQTYKRQGNNEQAFNAYLEAFQYDPRALAVTRQRMVELGYVAASNEEYNEEFRNGVRACVADPDC